MFSKARIILLLLFTIGFSYIDDLNNHKKIDFAAEIITYNGIVLYREQDEFYWQDLKTSTKLYKDDEIKTTTESYCELKLFDGSVIKMEPNTQLSFNFKKEKNKGFIKTINIPIGKIWVKATKRSEPIFYRTPYASVSIKGTMFSIDAPSGLVSTYEGIVEVANSRKIKVVSSGYEIYVDESGEMKGPDLLSAETVQNFENFTYISSLSEDSLKQILQTIKKQTDYKDIMPDESQQRKENFLGSLKSFFKNLLK